MNEQVAQSEEAFISGMEHEPEPVEAQKPVWRDVHISTARNLFQTHSMSHSVRDIVHSVLELVTRLAARMKSVTDRGPNDFEQPEDESTEQMAERVARIIARRYGAPRHTAYNNGDTGDSGRGNGEKKLLSWILGILSALVVIALAGGFTLYGEFTALKATVATGMGSHEQRINRLEADRDQQRYRGANPTSP